MSTGAGPCYTFGSDGIHVVLSSLNPTQYFCIESGEAFALYNANSSGSGWIRIGCSSNGNPTGSLGINIPAGLQRNFQSDSSCDFSACPY
jgi:hypothetical protein